MLIFRLKTDIMNDLPKDAPNTTTLTRTAIRTALKSHVQTRDDLFAVVRQTFSQHHLSQPPIRKLLSVYRELITTHPDLADPLFERLLIKARIRSLSGVAIITVLTKPYPCPGRCVYCPSEARMPKSYLSNEPAAMRALTYKFDPYHQVIGRLQALTNNGHPTDKIELIVKGGTWSAYRWDYRCEFIRRCFDACNDFTAHRHKASFNLSTSQLRNESATQRIVGLTLETRPDFINSLEIARLRELGCTRIELGVQTINDKILTNCHRDHDSSAVIQATALLKNAGFKVDYHLMPQLPGATPKSDTKMLQEIFDNSDYRPDMIKIYPCAVLETAELYNWWKSGRYRPYSDAGLLETLIAIKKELPLYCRVSRVIRDIPSSSIMAGNSITSLRQNIEKEMKARGLSCRCLRCREVGRVAQTNPDILSIKPKLFDEIYEASGGTEHFLSFEDPKRRAVFAFCRLRLPRGITDPQNLPTEIRDAALLRELHTYGHLVPIDNHSSGSAQHRGHGRQLMNQAEKLAREAGFKKMAVISGIGVRAYYRKLGYRRHGTYMIKKLDLN
ncbi:TPA: tRNA uridine(34) 5-carboxymethylaminomethyl modification radical SAM/GNAT enzyme Elp3 [Candidatus Uhrbacteria bacterium]|nr:tRNA uridine(34) 5-carboxymethylaminomethyl modification radical SAM/GNAT enzyme Elp3 [Candidatus Uhrbacteria bacterium]